MCELVQTMHVESLGIIYKSADMSVFDGQHKGSLFSASLKLIFDSWSTATLQWSHNKRDGVSNHVRDCLLNRLFRRRSKKTSKIRVTGPCEGNSPEAGEYRGPVTWKMFPFNDVIMQTTPSARSHSTQFPRFGVDPTRRWQGWPLAD